MNADSALRWLPTLWPSQPTWTASPPERNFSYRPHPPSPFIITQPEGWYSFYRPTEGGRLSRHRHCSKGVQPVPKAVYRSGCRDKHNCPRWDSNLGPLTPQSGMLPLGHCDTVILNEDVEVIELTIVSWAAAKQTLSHSLPVSYFLGIIHYLTTWKPSNI